MPTPLPLPVAPGVELEPLPLGDVDMDPLGLPGLVLDASLNSVPFYAAMGFRQRCLDHGPLLATAPASVKLPGVPGRPKAVTAISTVGSVMGTILIGYVLIPLLPNSLTLILTAGLLLVSGHASVGVLVAVAAASTVAAMLGMARTTRALRASGLS